MLQGQKVEIKTTSFDPIPMDKYTCLITDVNLVNQLKYQSTEEEEVLNYQFQVLDDKPMTTEGDIEASTRGRFLWKRCRLSLNSKSWLGKLAKAVVGRDMTKDELDSFDPESLVGKQVDIMLEQAESKDGQKVFNNIVAFNKTIKLLEPLDNKEVAKVAPVVEKKTAPAVAPDADNEADQLVANLNVEEKEVGEILDAPEDAEIAEMEKKLAEAKKKKAKVMGK